MSSAPHSLLPAFKPSDFAPFVSTSILASVLSVTPRRVRQLVASGVLPRAASGEFDLVECAKLYIRYLEGNGATEPSLGSNGSTTLKAARIALIEAKTKREQLKLEFEAGRLVPIEEVRKEWASLCSIIRDRCMALAPRLAPELEGLNGREIEIRIDREVRALLTVLAHGKTKTAPETPQEESDDG